MSLPFVGGKTNSLWLPHQDDQEEGSGSTHFSMSSIKHLLSTQLSKIIKNVDTILKRGFRHTIVDNTTSDDRDTTQAVSLLLQ